MLFGQGRARELFVELAASRDAVLEKLRRVVPEDEYLDFKCVTSTLEGKGKLNETDKKTLAKSLSGFWNGDGGVIVWGIDEKTQNCAPEDRVLTGGKFPLKRPEVFREKVLASLRNVTDPPIVGTELSDPMELDDGSHMVLMYVPGRSYRPPARAKGSDGSYYFRVADQFHAVPADFLAQMLGVRAPPILVATTHARPGHHGSRHRVPLVLRNFGAGVSREPYASVQLSGCDARRIEFSPKENDFVTICPPRMFGGDRAEVAVLPSAKSIIPPQFEHVVTILLLPEVPKRMLIRCGDAATPGWTSTTAFDFDGERWVFDASASTTQLREVQETKWG